MVQFEEITTTPKFLTQFENKILYTEHGADTSVSYKSTYTLKYVIEGTKYYNFNNEEVKVSKNQFLILNNDKNIRTEALSGTKGLSFFLSQKYISEIYSYHSNNDLSLEFFEISQTKTSNKIGNWLQRAAFLFKQDPIAFKSKKEDLLIQLSEILVTEQITINDNFNSLKIIKHNTKQELYKSVSLAKECINETISDQISLDSLSKNVGVSKYYLHRLFTGLIGKTPLEYITHTRIKKAKDELQNSNKTVFELAIECGFENTSYFSNVFKKHTGYSPSQYRKLL